MDSSSNARASLAGFVSTTVLTSSDGLFGDNVEEKRVTEAPAPRPEDSAVKPLYEQLQERKDKKDSEWKEKNNPFAPPKGLDEEEFEYIQDLESKKDDVERKRQAQHEEDLAQFLVARGAPKSAAGAQLTSQHLQKHSKTNELKTMSNKKSAVVVVKTKRKAGTDKANSKSTKSTEQSKEEPLKKKQKVEKLSETKKQSNTAALGLAAYGSDSDTDEADAN